MDECKPIKTPGILSENLDDIASSPLVPKTKYQENIRFIDNVKKTSKMGIFNRKKEINYVEEEEGLFETQEDSSDSDIPDLTDASLSLPYSKIIDQCVAFDDPNLKRLLPSCHLRLTVQDVYMKGKKIWYLLELEHGSFKWFLKKRFREALYLHHQLQMLRALWTIQLPEIRLSFHKVIKVFMEQTEMKYKCSTKAAMENYLKSLLKIPCFRNAQDTLEFLEIGPLSFVEDLGPKGKEGYVWKRCCYQDTGFGLFDSLCLNGCTFWKKRWLFLKENFTALMNNTNGQLDGVLLLDRAFRVFVDKRAARSKDGIIIQNLNKKLYLRCENEHQAEDWAAEINYVLNGFQADFVRMNSYGSYAPSRSLSKCRWIVDGATYFEAVAEVLEKAQEEIFITDWWLTPEIYLKRPTVQGHYWQLDYLLRRKARSGVRIYILLYKELELALGINSFHSEQKLIRMHKNIKVLRHPDVKKGILLWAHHEKLVCVDQTYAFVGGLDLCYGRWDDYQHRLSDFGDFEKKLKILRHMSTTSPNDISANHRIRKTSSLPHLSAEEIQIAESSTKPSQIPKFKTIVRKLQVAKEFGRLQQTLATELKDTKDETETVLPNLIPADRRRTIQQMALIALGMERKFRLWHGKDYVNFICRDFENLHQPYADIIDRKTTPRMPWHDIGLFVQGEPARDIARHFIIRWNQAKEEICPEDFTYPYLMPKAYAKFNDNTSSWLYDIIGTIYSAECQVLRSLCLWSGGISETENSIQEAYIQVIREAKHFIYIENQFFISQPSGDRNVLNGIADALYYRILKAHRNRNLFRVYVLLPLLPAFEGELGKGSGTLIQVITHWNYKSICRGPNSLYQRLSCHSK
ncbi:phospholipase D2-like [Stegodyphus dumicola]|uniref:phospholipase D2-like n=1 Tax=Stegodyphus dumicola TaxID=202533 RepID=UPI0015B35940|nr:phospholipase D2-like [Stegodyphus dumicola]